MSGPRGAAGLRLAAISLGQHPNPEQFIREFSGSDGTVAGYLLAEVLERQPAEVRDLLLRTSILEQVSGPLADCLTGGPAAERILRELKDANAFVTSLDVGRTWFRYHHLFADLLQLELRRTAPAIVTSLHGAAAQWLRGRVTSSRRSGRRKRRATVPRPRVSCGFVPTPLPGMQVPPGLPPPPLRNRAPPHTRRTRIPAFRGRVGMNESGPPSGDEVSRRTPNLERLDTGA
jgi:hypothetical protein